MSERVLLIVSGSVAAANAPGLCDRLRGRLGAAVSVVLTENARRFVTPEALYAMGGADEVLEADEAASRVPAHIRLSDSCSAVLVYPASAGFIGKLANGLALDLASTTMLACSGKRTLVVPSMSAAMWSHVAVQRNLRLLADAGLTICPTDSGLAPSALDVVQRFAAIIQPGGDENDQGQEKNSDTRDRSGSRGAGDSPAEKAKGVRVRHARVPVRQR